MASVILGNLSNTATVVEFAAHGAVAVLAYRNFASPHKTLSEACKILLNIKTHLDGVTPTRRHEIEAAAARNKCRGLEDIEGEFQNLWDIHSDLSQKYEESSYIQRHLSGELRSLINRLDFDVKILMNDTRTTTRAQPIQVIPSIPPPLPGCQSNSTSTHAQPPFPIFPYLPPISTKTPSAVWTPCPSVPFATRESIEMYAV